MDENSRYIFILKDDETEKDIDLIKTELESKIKSKTKIKLTKVDVNEIPQISDAFQFGFVFSIAKKDCDDTQYFKIINKCGKKIRGKERIIISISESFNDLYTKLYLNYFQNHYLIIDSSGVLDLSDLSNKAQIPCDFNSVSFAHTLYLLCYEFQQNNTQHFKKGSNFRINEIVLEDNKINIEGFNFFNDLIKYFFMNVKKVYLRRNDIENDLPKINDRKVENIEYYIFDDNITIIARQTDLKEERIASIVKENNWHTKSLSFIINEIQKLEKDFKVEDYQYPEEYELHQRRYAKNDE